MSSLQYVKCKLLTVNKPKAVFVIGKIKSILRAKMIRGFFKNGIPNKVAPPIYFMILT